MRFAIIIALMTGVTGCSHPISAPAQSVTPPQVIEEIPDTTVIKKKDSTTDKRVISEDLELAGRALNRAKIGANKLKCLKEHCR